MRTRETISRVFRADSQAGTDGTSARNKCDSDRSTFVVILPAEAHARDVMRRLRGLAQPKRAAALQRYFKTGPGEYAEGDRFLGLTLPEVRRVAREAAGMPLRDVTTLLRSPWHEVRTVALLILVRQYERGTSRERAALYRTYLRNTRRINNWDLVDCSAGQVVGAHVFSGRGRGDVLARLALSPWLWDRRIAVLATFYFIRHGRPREALRVVSLLLDDEHDLIHKACGWMLREVGKGDRSLLERFLRRHGRAMPRTTLRYAIERFPPRLRERYLRTRPVARHGLVAAVPSRR